MPLALGPNPIVKAMLGSVELPQMYLGDIPLLGPVVERLSTAAFNGTTSDIRGNNGNAVDVPQQWAISLWVKPRVDQRHGLVNGFSSTNYSDSLLLDTGGALWFQFYYTPNSTNNVYKTALGVIPVGEWTHIYVECNTFNNRANPGWVKLWVNGVETAFPIAVQGGSVDTYGSMVANTGDQRIGDHYNANGKLDGELAAVDVLDVGVGLPFPGVYAFGRWCDGTWLAKKYEGEYNNLGYGFQFDNAADYSEDSSENAYAGYVATDLVAGGDGPIVCVPEPINILNSCMFDRTANTSIAGSFPNPPADTSPYKKTHSFWYKRSVLQQEYLFTSELNTNNRWVIYFDTSNRLTFYYISAGVGGVWGQSTRQFTEVDKWHHFVIAVDNTLAADRCIVWVDGVQITAWDIAPVFVQNSFALSYLTSSSLHAGIPFYIGNSGLVGSVQASGLFAAIDIVDGLQLPADEFGVFDENNDWQPIAYGDGYGANGFQLKFETDTNLGADTSGNGKTFTLTNITADNQFGDTPSNNCSVFDPTTLFPAGSGLIREGGTVSAPASTAPIGTVTGTFPVPVTGKWYTEVSIQSISGLGIPLIGALSGAARKLFPGTIGGYPVDAYISYSASDGSVITSNAGSFRTLSPAGDSYVLGDYIGVAIDRDANTIEFYKNGVGQGVIQDYVVPDEMYFMICDGAGSGTWYGVMNNGQIDIQYPIAGHQLLIEQNFPVVP